MGRQRKLDLFISSQMGRPFIWILTLGIKVRNKHLCITQMFPARFYNNCESGYPKMCMKHRQRVRGWQRQHTHLYYHLHWSLSEVKNLMDDDELTKMTLNQRYLLISEDRIIRIGISESFCSDTFMPLPICYPLGRHNPIYYIILFQLHI